MHTRSRLHRLVIEALTIGSLVASMLAVGSGTAAAATGTCIQDGDGSFVKDICIGAPENGATVSGPVSVTGTVDPVNSPRTLKVEFYLDGEYVLTDFRSSSNSMAVFDFVLPTTRWVDGTHRLEMRALTRPETGIPAFTSVFVGIDLTFDNGVTEIVPNTNTFTPSLGRPAGPGETYTIAAVGDGPSGEPDSEAVADLIVGQDPNLFLYLGDVYEKGTPTEFLNWYGDETRSWGRLKSITNPTVGNHEYENGVAPGYFDYWDNVSPYYSFDVAGWHVISLASVAAFRDNPEQMAFLQNDIASNSARCTIAYWGDPRWTIGTQGDNPEMDEEWRALVESGVDIVIAADDHNYQRWEALDADGRLDPNGAVSFVVGTGGHGIRPFALGESDLTNPRVARAGDAFTVGGSLFLDLHDDGADFRFLEADGTTFDSGNIPCRADAPDPAATYRESISRVAGGLDSAAQSLSGTARDRAREASAELHKVLDDDKYWTADGSVSDSDGRGVFDKMKKAVEKLRDVNDPPASITGAIADLVAESEAIAQERIDFAAANNGDPGKVAEARATMSSAAAKLAGGEPHKAIDEYKKAWEIAGDAGGWVSAGQRESIFRVAAGLDAAAQSSSGTARDRALEASAELHKVLDDNKYWTADGTVSDSDGTGVFDKMKRAVEKLRDVKNPPAPITGAIADLVAESEAIARARIDQAVADGGSASKIAEANAKMTSAAAKLAGGEPHKAIDEYKKAWEKARDA